MAIIQQKTYTCKCGKRKVLPALNSPVICGCGRTARLDDGRVVLEDKKRK